MSRSIVQDNLVIGIPVWEGIFTLKNFSAMRQRHEGFYLFQSNPISPPKRKLQLRPLNPMIVS